MAIPMSGGVLKRRRSWRTLPGLVIAFAMLFGLWQISTTFHAASHLHGRFPLGARRTTLQNDFQFDSETSEVEMPIEKGIEKVASDIPHLRNLERAVKHLETILVEKLQATDAQLQHEFEVIRSENEKLKGQLVSHLVETPTWKPLKDLSKFSILGFLSDMPDRGMAQGPPQLFEFPSALSNGRLLCFLGNSTSNGTRNFYTYTWEDALSRDHIFLEGTTLISETQYDFENPWHSMYNLVQFVYWKKVNGCAHADRLLLYHWSELRRRMGGWITQVFTAAGLPVVPYQMEVGDRPICFQRAVVSRTGIGGVPHTDLQEIFTEVRCLVRQYCKIPVTSFKQSEKQRVRITLMARNGTREWKNQTEWEAVIAAECGRIQGCEWSTMHISTLTFCEQAEIMSRTDILVSVHGAQLTNMIFMSPGGRVMEMFPKGWLELAGHGQFIYKHLAEWLGVSHEGYWRDLDHADCPFGNDNVRCMTHFKDLAVGINVTHISAWLRHVVTDFNAMIGELKKPVQERTKPEVEVQQDSDRCACRGKQR
ncbi:hypothetical protein KC19_7G070900 [Ceratodon purpureus]|uniref:Glycosyltransferase 61 catalytic domain-containing protein n=1 Tax=Ceratodon purpureus TaxID=3225 RepID=A0A8T0H8I3_CERPU|nr:hypothetical protein KC19_7G070900 [Ceratodon purpureus]